MKSEKRRVLIMGAAGRDFHNFNVYFRNNPRYEVVCFTATQIPYISDRNYPKALCGEGYPKGIPIYPEEELMNLLIKEKIDEVIFAYSDVSHEYLMHKASQVIAAGADFTLMGANSTMIKSKVPMISICAVRTGCGKSQTTRKVANLLRAKGKKVVAIRHPMPYGDLWESRVQRYSTMEDLDKYKCTIEEREEYEPHIANGTIIYAGVDYEAILRQAEKEADIIIWDGGNNDIPFYCSDLEIVVADPHRPGHEVLYHPGEVNIRRAHCIVINKIDTAKQEGVDEVMKNIRNTNPDAIVIEAASPIRIDKPELIEGKRVVVIEDGPTVTHGGMAFGAGVVAAKKYGAKEIVDPRKHLYGSIKETYEKYPKMGAIIPAMGYADKQIDDLEETINKLDCDAVVIGTPIDLRRVIDINKPAVRVTYELEEIGKPDLDEVLKKFY
jgi:predicted GTPase